MIEQKSTVTATYPVSAANAVRLQELNTHTENSELHAPPPVTGGAQAPFTVECRNGHTLEIAPVVVVDENVHFRLYSTDFGSGELLLWKFKPIDLPGIDMATATWSLSNNDPGSFLLQSLEEGVKQASLYIYYFQEVHAVLTVSGNGVSYSMIVEYVNTYFDPTGRRDAVGGGMAVRVSDNIRMPALTKVGSDWRGQIYVGTSPVYPIYFYIEPFMDFGLDITQIAWSVYSGHIASLTSAEVYNVNTCTIAVQPASGVPSTGSVTVTVRGGIGASAYTISLTTVLEDPPESPGDLGGYDGYMRVLVMTEDGPKWKYPNISCSGDCANCLVIHDENAAIPTYVPG